MNVIQNRVTHLVTRLLSRGALYTPKINTPLKTLLAASKVSGLYFGEVKSSVLSSTLSLPWSLYNSPYCLPYNSYDVTLGSLVLDQQIIPY